MFDEIKKKETYKKHVNAMKLTKASVFVADFETTSLPNLNIDHYVRVWLWSLVEVESKKAYYGYDIKSFLQHIDNLDVRICYFHNLKFDGSFLLDYFVRNNIPFDITAPRGVWFSLEYNRCEFRDSLKKFKMTVKGLSIFLGMECKLDVSDDTGKHPWDYYIPLNYTPSLKEIEYCVHDSRIVATAIEREWDAGRRRLTTSSEAYNNCKKYFKNFDVFSQS